MISPTRLSLFLMLALAFTHTALACPDCGCEAGENATTAATAATTAAAGHAHAHPHDHPHETAAHKAPAQDRKAILAMAGEYRVTFQFQETVATLPDYEISEPYRAEATEFVEVIENTGDYISLQHVLVMKNKKTGKSRVIKHWRQDWTYQDTDILAFRGNLSWEHVMLDPETARGTWSQAVYQVDDSPRYESFGKWTHVGDRSAWESAETWRPLPRREYSHRDDYHVLVARNRHTITPQGWVHEQDNFKLVLDEQGAPESVIAHESGLNVYDRTDDVDFSAGRLYWEQTAAYWQDVRDIWSETFDKHQKITLESNVDGQKLYAALFALAKDVQTDGDIEAARNAAVSTVKAFSASSE